MAYSMEPALAVIRAKNTYKGRGNNCIYIDCYEREGYPEIHTAEKIWKVARVLVANQYKLDYFDYRGWEPCHKCDDPSCIFMGHLYPGTRKNNMGGRLRRGRNPQAIKTHCPRNHEYTPENTYLYGTNRVCKQCTKIRNRVRREKGV